MLHFSALLSNFDALFLPPTMAPVMYVIAKAQLKPYFFP